MLETKHFCLISNALCTLFATRFERATFRLGGGRSIQLSYANLLPLPAIPLLPIPAKSVPTMQWCYYNAFSLISVLQSHRNLIFRPFRSKIVRKATLPYRSAVLLPADNHGVIPVTADPSARSGIFPAALSPVPRDALCHGTFSCRQESGFPPPCFLPPGKQHSRS